MVGKEKIHAGIRVLLLVGVFLGGLLVISLPNDSSLLTDAWAISGGRAKGGSSGPGTPPLPPEPGDALCPNVFGTGTATESSTVGEAEAVGPATQTQ